LGQTVFLFAALFLMIKLQKLNCHPLALLGSAALACALDYIPFVGIELSVLALLLCITKAIGARTFTDAIFTTGISYALTFCFNLFVLSALMGDLRPSVRVRARMTEPDAVAQQPVVAVDRPAGTNAPPVATAEPRPVGNAAPAAPADPIPERVKARPAPKTDSVVAGKMAAEVAAHFAIRGISKGAVQTVALISDGTRSYDVVAGDSFQMQTSSGRADAVCDSADENKVVLEVEGVRVNILHKPVAR
jgi:hypothetical protein